MSHFKRLPLSELRAQEDSPANQINKTTWYQMTEEYEIWERSDTSAFLWFRGRSGAGKTSEITEILQLFDEGENGLVATVAYFCPKMPAKIKTVLRSIIIQLGQSSFSWVNSLDCVQKCDILSLIQPENSVGIEKLWNLFQSLLQALSDRKVCLILDGIDALHPEDLRGFTTKYIAFGVLHNSNLPRAQPGSFGLKS